MLTKADKISKQELDKVAVRTRNELAKHAAAHPDLLVTSSEKGLGIDILRATIAKLMSDHGFSFNLTLAFAIADIDRARRQH